VPETRIKYAIVALQLSSTQVTAIIKDVTGVTVDPAVGNFLEALSGPQLEYLWKRLSEDGRWKASNHRLEQARKLGLPENPSPTDDVATPPLRNPVDPLPAVGRDCQSPHRSVTGARTRARSA